MISYFKNIIYIHIHAEKMSGTICYQLFTRGISEELGHGSSSLTKVFIEYTSGSFECFYNKHAL